MSAADKAWYWVAAGVLALGLNGYYLDGGLATLHHFAGQRATAAADVGARFQQVTASAEVALAGHPHTFCRRPEVSVAAMSPMVFPSEAQARLAQAQERMAALESGRMQARMARLQPVIARREMQRAQVEIWKGRIAVLSRQGQVRIAPLALPQVEVNVPQGPAFEVTPN